jgi:uncharacterized membrane protein YraQ (UPF0718 family)
MDIERMKKLFNGRAVFFVGVVVAYGIVLVTVPDQAKEAIWKSLSLLLGVLPALIGVFVLMTLSELILDTKRLTRVVGSGSGTRGWILAISGGVLSSGPIYLWYPLLADLRERGMREGYVAAFLLARAVKLPLLPVMAFSFGWVFVIAFSLLLFVASLLGGMVSERLLSGVENGH